MYQYVSANRIAMRVMTQSYAIGGRQLAIETNKRVVQGNEQTRLRREIAVAMVRAPFRHRPAKAESPAVAVSRSTTACR